MKLSPAAWRTLYNVADALRPAPEGNVAVDLAPAVEAALASPAEVRVLRRTLRWLELETRLRRAPVRGFCWLSREERRAVLEQLQRSPFAVRRQAFARLAAVVDSALSPHSLPGA